MSALKTIKEAMTHLLFFKPYTVYPRWMEIAYGINAWVCIGLIIWTLSKF